MKNKIALILALTMLLTLCFVGCGPKTEYVDGKVVINFWGWGDKTENDVFSALTTQFNKQSKHAYVRFTKKPGGTYSDDAERQLGTKRPPDIVYAGDFDIKKWAAYNLVEDLTPMIEASEVYDMDDLWPSLRERYQFDNKNFTYSPDAPIWGLPKDLGPTAIYYNKSAFEEAGVTVVEDMPIDEVIAEDERFGYYVKNGQKFFNNSIPMSWEEMVELSTFMTKSKNPSSPTDYGYYTNWWFNFGWSVGGDVMKFVPSDDPNYAGGTWEFSLGDTQKNYIKDGKFEDENGNRYTAATPGVKELPSMREAFDFFVSLSTSKGISPRPEDAGNLSGLFTSQKIAMFVEGRYYVPQLRQDCEFEWDVAPLPKHKDGVQAGHSGSMCLSIATRSTHKQEAFEFIEYLSGPIGQTELCKAGFNVPNQMSVANSDVFLVSDLSPYNNKVFLDAAGYERGGDWTFMPDTDWIDIWAPYLNNDILNSKPGATVDKMFELYTGSVNKKLKTYTEVKK